MNLDNWLKGMKHLHLNVKLSKMKFLENFSENLLFNLALYLRLDALFVKCFSFSYVKIGGLLKS